MSRETFQHTPTTVSLMLAIVGIFGLFLLMLLSPRTVVVKAAPLPASPAPPPPHCPCHPKPLAYHEGEDIEAFSHRLRLTEMGQRGTP